MKKFMAPQGSYGGDSVSDVEVEIADYRKKKIAERQKAWRARNADRVRESSKLYYERNKEKRRAYAKKYYSEHKDEQRDRAKRYRELHYSDYREKNIVRCREYRAAHREELNRRRREKYAKMKGGMQSNCCFEGATTKT